MLYYDDIEKGAVSIYTIFHKKIKKLIYTQLKFKFDRKVKYSHK